MRCRPRLLLVLLALAVVPTAASAEEPTQLASDGVPRTFVLGGERSMAVFAVEVPEGARALHVLVVAPYDVDLYVHDAPLAEDALDDARHRADSLLTVEHVVVRPSAGEVFSKPLTQVVHVLSPWADERACKASLLAVAEREDPVLAPGAARRVVVPAGEDSITVRVPVPRLVADAYVLAEAARGRPELRVRALDGDLVSRPRGRGSLLHLEGRALTGGGARDVEVHRPEGEPVDAPYVTSLDLALLSAQQAGDSWDEDEARQLQGERGRHTFSIREDSALQAFFDVPVETASVRLRALAPDGDVDLYVTRHRPVVMTSPANWEYCSWKDGEEEVLVLGGTEPLPVGRYWVRLHHVDGEDEAIELAWEHRPHLPLASERLPAAGRLGLEPQRVAMGANEPISWWDLPANLGPGLGVRVLDADKDIDLVVQRGDTGGIVARSTTDRHAEGLLLPPDLVIPAGVPLRLGVCRWTVTDPAYAGELHIASDGIPPLPPDYFPPFGAFGDDARSRTLAASVFVDLEDGSASGVVVSPTGLILTCHHVVEEVLDGGEIRVAFPTSPRGRPRELYFAEVVDASEPDDLALVRLTTDVFGRPVPADRRHAFVPIGSSRDTPIETPIRIVAYGSAGSSNFNSNLVVLHGVLAGVEVEGDRETWLLTDARVGPGNSGGGYFDPEGRLIGIHTSGIGPTGSTLGYGKPESLIPAAWRARIEAEGGSAGLR